MPIRVGMLLQDMPRIYGAERATLDLVTGLAAGSVVTPEILLIHETRRGREIGEFGLALRATGLPCAVLSVDRPFSRPLTREIARMAGEGGMQVVHAVGPKADVHLALARGAFRRVSTLHGWLFRRDWKEALHERLDAWALRRMDRVVVLSRYYEALLNRKGIPACRIPTGFRVDSIAGSPRTREHAFCVGMLGRLSSEKNHQQLFRAIRDVPGRVLVAGDGPEEARLRRLATTLGIADRVEFAGFMPRAELFARIDALVLCSRVENLPYAIMEAMAAGVPVLATRVGGIPDLIEDGRSGWLVELDDAPGLAEALRACQRDPAEAQLRAVRAREHLERCFAPAGALAAHESLYRELGHA